MRIILVPKGSIRAHIRGLQRRGLVEPGPATAPPTTREDVRREIMRTIPLYTPEVGRAELDNLIARANRNGR